MTRLLLAVAVLALVATGCGAADDEPNLAQAAARTEDTGSSRFALWGTETDGAKQVEITCAGEAQYDSKRLRLRCEHGSTQTMELVAVGNATYVRGELLGFGLGSDKWLKLTDGESLGAELSPQRLLAMLRGASQSTERLGADEVHGVDTERLRLEVDCSEVELTDCTGSTAPVDVWVGDDGLVRRIAVEEGQEFTFEFFDFGVELDIRPPPPGDVEDVDTLFGSVTCEPAFGSPVRLERAIDAARQHGFTVTGEPRCSADSASFENDPGERADEGHVYCLVRSTPPAGAPTRVEPLGTGVASMALRLQNVECTLVAESRAEAKLARLKAALADLKR